MATAVSNKTHPEGLEAAEAEFGNVDNDGDWIYEEIVLDRGNGGLGFSIAGGVDHPPVGGECCLFITKLIQGGAAADDGRLQLNDVVLRVNNIDVSKATHANAVDVLKRAGKNVVLFVKRRKYHADKMLNIKLVKGSTGLGISIAGGKDNQHVPGDNGIFISKIIEGGAAQRDGRLSVMDRLIAVNDQNLEGVTHEQAVLALKNAHDTVRLTVAIPNYLNQAAAKPKGAVKSQTKQDIEPIKGKADNIAVDR